MELTRLPPWIRKPLQTNQNFNKVHGLVNNLRLHTVSEEAKCPNRHECWSSGTATVMILGDTCTRSCRFCSVKSGRPLELDHLEPRRVAAAAKEMALKHIVITSVNRDDQLNGGADIFGDTIRAVKEAVPEITVEVLTPDFEGREASLHLVLEAAPHVFSHNIETVRHLQAQIRPQANYGRSMWTLRTAAAWRPQLEVKSGIMVGLGETEEQVIETLEDLVENGATMLTIGQYLRPSMDHEPVHRFVHPDEFARYEEKAREIGFQAVASGPFVRSSFKAETLYDEMVAWRGSRSNLTSA
ncbi:MAG: lipoyl synthase [Kiritimatiellae bacterium]|jgi:lipoic acid synthetase|nr:lipoyl synthase [Kiritimatiellia bacterium]